MTAVADRRINAGELPRAEKSFGAKFHDVITTTEDMPLMNLIHVLQERHLIRLPVVKDQKLIGMVARRDIVFAYVKARANYWP